MFHVKAIQIKDCNYWVGLRGEGSAQDQFVSEPFSYAVKIPFSIKVSVIWISSFIMYWVAKMKTPIKFTEPEKKVCITLCAIYYLIIQRTTHAI